MERTLKWSMVNLLVINPEFTGTYGQDDFVWKDVRPFPTFEKINQLVIDRTIADDIKLNNKTAYVTHQTTLAAGYTHTDGFTYYCDEHATTDMVKVLTLFDLDPSEPVTVFTFDGTIRDLTYLEFVDLAKAIGNHQYSLRKVLWSNLQR